MDHEQFDRLTRGLAAGASRRSALAALLGSGLVGAAGLAGTAKARKDRGKKRRGGAKAKGSADVTAQAVDCLSPSSSSNISGCSLCVAPPGGGVTPPPEDARSRHVPACHYGPRAVGAHLSKVIFRGRQPSTRLHLWPWP